MSRWLTGLPLLLLAALLLGSSGAAAESIESTQSQATTPSGTPGVEEEPPIDLIELDKARRARTRLYPMGTRVTRYMSAAGEAMSDGNDDEALSLLLRLNPDRLNPYERAFLFRLLAYVNYSKTEYDKAIDYFNLVLDQDILFVADEARVRFSIVQLNAAVQRWEEVVRTIHVWFRYVPEPTPLSYYLLSIAHYQLDQTDLAIVNAEKALDLSTDPQESWLQLLAALYVQKQDYANATPVLEELLTSFPKREYWVQLSLIYGALENYRHSLAVQQIAYAQGYLSTDSEMLRLTRSYLFANLPYEAATLLQEGLDKETVDADADAYELLANCWIQAREFERSLEPLTKAAELADTGNLFVRLGQVRMQREEWPAAARLFIRAIEKGELEDPGLTQLLLGISYYNDNRVDNARSSFARARKHDNSRKQADDWITHIENESKKG